MKIINLKGRLSLWNTKHAFDKFQMSNLTLNQRPENFRTFDLGFGNLRSFLRGAENSY